MAQEDGSRKCLTDSPRTPPRVGRGLMAYRSGRSAIGRNNSDSWEDQDAPEADDSRVFLRSSNVNVGVDHLQGLWNSGRGTIVRIEGSRLAFSNGAEAEVAVDHE